MWNEFDRKVRPYNLGILFRQILIKAWNEFEEDDDSIKIGSVQGGDVVRWVTSFIRV